MTKAPKGSVPEESNFEEMFSGWNPIAGQIERGERPELEDLAEALRNDAKNPPKEVRQLIADLLEGKNKKSGAPKKRKPVGTMSLMAEWQMKGSPIQKAAASVWSDMEDLKKNGKTVRGNLGPIFEKYAALYKVQERQVRDAYNRISKSKFG